MFLRKQKNTKDYFATLPIELLHLIARYLVNDELKYLAIFSLLNKKTHAESLNVAANTFPNYDKVSALDLMQEKQSQYEDNQIKGDPDKYLKIIRSKGYAYIEKHIISVKNGGLKNGDHYKDGNYYYEAAMILFSDYCKHQPYYLRGAEKAARFFSGAWNHSHIDAVTRLMMKHDPSGLGPEPSSYPSLQIMLQDLQYELLIAGKVLKKNGELAKRIKFIQEISGEKVIDFGAICDEKRFKTLQQEHPISEPREYMIYI